MTVECESCKTRFHVADARIPAKGARVRCSRCHHRFHITPSYAPPKQPRPPAQGSAPEAVLGADAGQEEDQLDNPQFLFDKPEAAAPRPARGPRIEPEEPAAEVDTPPPPTSTLAPEPKPALEERVVASSGLTAQEMLDDGAPEIPTGRFDIGDALGEPDSEIGGGDDASRASARSLLGGDLGESTDTPPPPAPSKPAKPAFADIAAIAAELGEDEDTSFSDWDPLAAPGPAAASASAAASGPRTTKLFPDAPKAAPAASRAKGRAVPDAPVFDPEAAGPAALVLRVAAAIVGLALAGAAGRLLWLQRASEPSVPQVVQAAGWVAADLETFLARSADGERVVVVRGNLFPDGAAPPPAVEVRLLGADGETLGEAPRTWLERIDDAEVAPEKLALRLAAAGGEIGAIGPMVTGFTAVIADPPPGVRRVEVALRAGERMPEGTATAVTPEAPVPAPEVETAAPTPAALPVAPSPADVVPAAPEPE